MILDFTGAKLVLTEGQLVHLRGIADFTNATLVVVPDEMLREIVSKSLITVIQQMVQAELRRPGQINRLPA